MISPLDGFLSPIDRVTGILFNPILSEHDSGFNLSIYKGHKLKIVGNYAEVYSGEVSFLKGRWFTFSRYLASLYAYYGNVDFFSELLSGYVMAHKHLTIIDPTVDFTDPAMPRVSFTIVEFDYHYEEALDLKAISEL